MPKIVPYKKLKPYDRQPGESVKSFQLFVIYRDLGIARSLERTLEVFRKKYPNTKATIGGVGYMSSKWQWVERARVWDAALDMMHRRSRVAASMEMNRRQIQISQAAQGLLSRELQKYIEKSQATDEVTLTPNEALSFGKFGVQLERTALGEPESIVEQRTEQNVKVDVSSIRETARRASIDEDVQEHIRALREKEVIIPEVCDVDT